MQRAVLIDSRLVGSFFHDTVLTGASLEGADFSRATVTHSLVNGAHLDGTSFREADLHNSRFVNARGKADFSGARNLPAHLQAMLDKQAGH
jgi:uncharacterized protein YjbI with pentapeptide repeats